MEWFSDMHKVRAISPLTGEIEAAVLHEDYFGPQKDAVRFYGFNTPYYLADKIAWEFVSDG